MDDRHLLEIQMTGLDVEANAVVQSLFDRWSLGGAVVEQGPRQTTLKAYLAADDTDSLREIEIGLALIDRVRASEAQNPLPPLQIRSLSPIDWAEAWKRDYHPLRVGKRLVVKPSWEPFDPRPHDLVIEMDPGMAFGSGLHATTRLCLALLEESLTPGAGVLDVGTGSGILAIAAARLGAAHVLAVDNDRLAVRVARENVALNGLQNSVRVETASLDLSDGTIRLEEGTPDARIAEQPFWDVIVVNILAETIIDMAAALAAKLVEGGSLIASGIISNRADCVAQALAGQRLSLVQRRREDEWVALVHTKS